jgi:hypothetical protein
MSDWKQLSDDGTRYLTVFGTGYAIYRATGPIDASAESRAFEWCGWVPTFAFAEQWLADGHIHGPVIEVPVTPTRQGKRGAAA